MPLLARSDKRVREWLRPLPYPLVRCVKLDREPYSFSFLGCCTSRQSSGPRNLHSELSTQEHQQFPAESAGLFPPGWARGGGSAILRTCGQDVLKAEGAITGG